MLLHHRLAVTAYVLARYLALSRGGVLASPGLDDLSLTTVAQTPSGSAPIQICTHPQSSPPSTTRYPERSAGRCYEVHPPTHASQAEAVRKAWCADTVRRRALPDIPHIWVPVRVRRDRESMLGWFAWIWGAAQETRTLYRRSSIWALTDNASIIQILLRSTGVDREVRATNTARR
ncbi:hypothetical protein C8T65DRAFT_60441 [Cerioporus squamosus]|nr:hypothetical protein C8T65DRAFT_60441 [Cerioporus squamosus]